MKIFKICLGLIISSVIWASVLLIISISNNTYKYQNYRHFSNIESALIKYTNEFYHEDYRIEEEYCVLTGTHACDKDLQAKSKVLVITGDIVINGELTLYDTELIIEGSLTVNSIEYEGWKVSTIKNYGYLHVNDSVGNSHGNKTILINDGEAIIGFSKISEYIIGSSSKLIVKNQFYDCIVNLDIMSIYVNRYDNPIEISGRSDEIVLKDYSGFTVDYDTYYGEVCESDINYGNLLCTIGIIVLLSIIIGFFCMLYTAVKTKKNIDNIEKYAGDAKISYFKGNIFIYTFFKAGIILLNIITLMCIKPYLDKLFYKWKWKNIVLFGKAMEFTADGDQIFYKNLLWAFLTLITLGIYSYKYTYYYMKWITGGIIYKGEPQMKNEYSNSIKEISNLFISAILWIISLYVIPFFSVFIILQIVRSIGLFIFLLIALCIAVIILFVFVLSKIYNNYIDIVWNGIIINGKALCSSHVNAKTFLKYFLFGIISLDGYLHTIDYKLFSSLVENT